MIIDIKIKVNEKRTRYERACLGKKKYKNKNCANNKAGCRSKEIGEKLYAYKCTFCHFWHIGHRYAKTEESTEGSSSSRLGHRPLKAETPV